MKLGTKEMAIVAGLTLLSCNSQNPTQSADTDGVVGISAGVRAALKARPREPDQTIGQLTGACTPVSQPLGGEQFPMKRGTELIKTLPDGTCLERLREGDDNVIYAISGDRKIKFSNPNPNQAARILAQSDFSALQQLGIMFVEEIESQASNAHQDPVTLARHLLEDPRIKPLRVLFEEPIRECPEYRYRKSMLADLTAVLGGVCIWRERSPECPSDRTSTGGGAKQWVAFFQSGKFVLKESDIPRDIRDGIATPPGPREWLGIQPECP